jgi:hypothetical protein
MVFREVSVVQIREALRRWLKGEGERPIAQGVGVDRKTARRYITAATELGLDRSGGEEQLTDEVIAQVVERVRPHRPDGHGEAWRVLLAEEANIKAWVKDDLTVVKIGILLSRRGVVVPHRTLARFAVERCGAGRRTVTVRVDDPPPGIELQVDFGRLGLVADKERRRVCHGLIFTACFSRHQFVWPTFTQTTEEVIRGFEAAWGYFGGVFPVVIPDNMKSIVIEAEHTAPRFNDTFMEYAQSRGFSIDAARVPLLLLLPCAPFDTPKWSDPKVHRDFHCQVDKAIYSVHHHLVGRTLRARSDSSTVKLYCKGELVKVHPRKPPGGRSTDAADMPSGTEIYATRDVERLGRMAADHGEAIGRYAAALLDTPLPWNKMRQVYRLLGLVKKWGADRVEEACRRALEAEAVDVNLVSRMIERARESTEPEGRPDPVVIQGRFARDPSEFSSTKEAGR